MSGPIYCRANLVVRFVLELCALAALCYWGFWAGDGPLVGLVLGLGAGAAVNRVLIRGWGQDDGTRPGA